MKRALLLCLLLLASAAAQEALPEGLRAGEKVGDVQVYLWKLPGDAGDLELVRVPADPPYFVARTEVTRKAYLAFCRAKDLPAPPAAPGADVRHPVADVTFDEARAFCAWAGLALPTEAEWQRAAQGTDGRAFPWGATTQEVRSNSCDASCPEDWPWKEAGVSDGFPFTAPVGSFPAGASPVGALDMAGNVWEWTESETDDGARVARGGGWCSPRVTGQTTFRNAFAPDTRWAGLGFRPVLRVKGR